MSKYINFYLPTNTKKFYFDIKWNETELIDNNLTEIFENDKY